MSRIRARRTPKTLPLLEALRWWRWHYPDPANSLDYIGHHRLDRKW